MPITISSQFGQSLSFTKLIKIHVSFTDI